MGRRSYPYYRHFRSRKESGGNLGGPQASIDIQCSLGRIIKVEQPWTVFFAQGRKIAELREGDPDLPTVGMAGYHEIHRF